MPSQIPTQLTAGHRRLHAALSQLGLILEDEVQVGKYVLDLYCRDYHLGFEYDGPLHEAVGRRTKDRARDAWILEHAGIPIYRVSEVELKREWFLNGVMIWTAEWCRSLNRRKEQGELWPLQSLV